MNKPTHIKLLHNPYKDKELKVGGVYEIEVVAYEKDVPFEVLIKTGEESFVWLVRGQYEFIDD